jgi:AraC family transcriptional activator of tynA and feaB
LHHAIDAGISEGSRVSCEDVANMAGISMRYANLLLAQEGTSLERLIIQRRLEWCCKMLANPQLNHHRIGDIALASGFGSASHFARSFKESFGITAREFRNEPAHYSAHMLNLPHLLQHLA